jgi:Transposase DDE domain
MTTIAELSGTLQKLFTSTADELAKKTGFIKRQRQVTGAGFAQTVVLGNLTEPEGTRKQLQHSARQAGMQVSVQGLDQRFTSAAVRFTRALLEEGLRHLVTSSQQQVVMPHFNGIYLTDSTRVCWPDEAIKVAVRLELQRGALAACLTDIKRHDPKTGIIDQPLPAGALHLGDLGFFKLKRFHQWSASGVYWLTRYKAGICLYTPDGQPIDLKTHLTGDQPVSFPVRMGRGTSAVTATLIAAPLPPDALTKRQARLKEQARLDQRPLSQRQRDLATWTIYLTTVSDLTFDQAHCLARTRWQIELLFKLWKSHALILRSRSANPIRQQCEGYAKLLGILVAHWLLLVAGWQHDRLGPVDALRILRSHVPRLRAAFLYFSVFAEVFVALAAELLAAPRLAKRRKSPAAFQFWYTFEQSFP